MRSLAVDFGEGGAVLDLERAVEGRDATVQAALINSVTELGSDPVYPDSRGTELRRRLMSGGAVDGMVAEHAANFAALRTRTFMAGLYQDPPYISRFVLVLRSLENGLVALDAGFSFTDGTSIGATAETEI